MNAAQVTLAKSAPVELIAERYQLQLRGQVEREGPCPVCGGTDRFAINIKKQVWNCRGCQKGGDVIALVQHLDGVDFRTAVETLVGQAPNEVWREPRHASDSAKRRASEYERKQHCKAAWLWQIRTPISGTPAEIYLRVRGYTGVIPPTLAYLPPSHSKHHPALISAIAFADETEPGVLATPHNVNSIHLTLLRPDGTAKAAVEKPKLIVGRPLGHPVVLAPPNDLLGLAITEGIEDGLSVHQATGLGVWAAGSAGNMPKLAPLVPNYIEVVTIFAHNDDAGRRGARALAEAIKFAEVRVEGVASW